MDQERELLLKMRGHMAYKKGVKPYVIFKDAELERLLEARPKTLEDLGKVKGFPIEGSRVTKWGQAIIDIFTRTDKVEDFDVSVDADGELVVKSKLSRMSAF